MAKWRVKKEQKGMFRWKAVSPDGHGTIRTASFAQAIRNVYELARQDAFANVTRLTVVGDHGRLFET